MLFVLTGNVQIGKTRWLNRLVASLSADGVRCAGVLAPGVWRRRSAGEGPSSSELRLGAAEDRRFEKLGIDNILLPQGTRIAFARRADLARSEGVLDEGSQAARAGLGWAIDDDAIAQVNRHFDALRATPPAEASLLVVDELGRLELMRGEGLTSALALLNAGPTEAFPHAIVVARDYLLPQARSRFEGSWGAVATIAPDDAGEQKVRAALRVR